MSHSTLVQGGTTPVVGAPVAGALVAGEPLNTGSGRYDTRSRRYDIGSKRTGSR